MLSLIKVVKSPISYLLLVLLGWSLGVHSATLDTLYHSDIVVTDKSQAERQRAEREGLSIVLVKVSGNASTIYHPQVAAAIKNPGRYVSEFSYVTQSADDSGRQTVALVSYSQSMVDQLLARAGRPIWPADRPDLLMWMVVDQTTEGRIHVSSDAMPEAYEQLKQYSAQRGQPLQLPLLDLEDHLTLSARDAWAFDRQALVAAARRYKVQHWGVLRFYETSGGKFRGTVQVEAGVHSGLENINADSLNELIRKGMDFTVDKIAAGSTFIRQHIAEEFTLLLENVDSFDDYQAAIELLADLKMVRSVRVASAIGDNLDLRLAIDGGAAGLLKILSRNKRLDLMQDLSGSGDSGRFRWR